MVVANLGWVDMDLGEFPGMLSCYCFYPYCPSKNPTKDREHPVILREFTDECEGLRACGDGDDEAGDGGAAEVDPAPLGQQHHPLPVRPDDVVHLRADLLPRQVLLEINMC